MARSGPGGPQYAAGIAASLLAEVAFIGMVMLVGLLRGNDPWMVTRMPAALLVGPSAVQPPGFVPGDVGLGLLLHLLLGVLVGLIYAALLPRLGLSPVAGGLLAGAILYVLGFWVLPLAFPSRLAPFWLPRSGRAMQAAAHAFYGVVFGSAYARLARAPS